MHQLLLAFVLCLCTQSIFAQELAPIKPATDAVAESAEKVSGNAILELGSAAIAPSNAEPLHASQGLESVLQMQRFAEQLRNKFAALSDSDPDVAAVNAAADALLKKMALPDEAFEQAALPPLPVDWAGVVKVLLQREQLQVELEIRLDGKRKSGNIDEFPLDTLGEAITVLRKLNLAVQQTRLMREIASLEALLSNVDVFLEQAQKQFVPSKIEIEQARTQLQIESPLSRTDLSGLVSFKQITEALEEQNAAAQKAIGQLILRLQQGAAQPNEAIQTRKDLRRLQRDSESALLRATRRSELAASRQTPRALAQTQTHSLAAKTALRTLESKIAQFAWLEQAEEWYWSTHTSWWQRQLSGGTHTFERLWVSAKKVLNYAIFTVGEAPITLAGALRVLLILVIAWFASKWLRAGLTRYGNSLSDVSRPALYSLGRVAHYLLLAIGTSVALSSIGLDLSKVAIFASALGVGIGFGLQTIVSNFISGLILLFERSLKLGDFVELSSGLHGAVSDISIRATRITTNSNIDILVPNSEFINGRVTNWTLREARRRIKIPFGVAYGTDKEVVKRAALEAAASVPFTLASEGPYRAQVWLVKFGASSLDFELVIWLTPDAVVRPGAVHAAYCWALDDALRKYQIEVPYPQLDLRLRSFFGSENAQAQTLFHSPSPHDHSAAMPAFTPSPPDPESAPNSVNDALDDALNAPKLDLHEGK